MKIAKMLEALRCYDMVCAERDALRMQNVELRGQCDTMARRLGECTQRYVTDMTTLCQQRDEAERVLREHPQIHQLRSFDEILQAWKKFYFLLADPEIGRSVMLPPAPDEQEEDGTGHGVDDETVRAYLFNTIAPILTTLCWVMKHTHHNAIETNLRRIEEWMERNNIDVIEIASVDDVDISQLTDLLKQSPDGEHPNDHQNNGE